MKYNHEKAQKIVEQIDLQNKQHEKIKTQLNQYFYVGDYLEELAPVLVTRFSDKEELGETLVAVSEILYKIITNDKVGWIDLKPTDGEKILHEVVRGLTESLEYTLNNDVMGYIKDIYANDFSDQSAS